MKKISKSKIRVALLSVLIVSMLTAMVSFMGVGAEGEGNNNVIDDPDSVVAETSEDVNPTSYPTPEYDPVASKYIIEPSWWQITVTTNKSVGEEIEFYLNSEEVYVDLGDGYVNVSWSYETSDGLLKHTGYLAGDTVKIYSTTPITNFRCNGQKLTSVNVSHAYELQELSCSNNSLNSLNLSNNSYLKTLNCSNNSFKSLDVSKNVSLETLNCSNNQLRALDVSKNVSLKTLNCSNNSIRFSTLSLSDNEISDFKFTPQTPISITESIDFGGSIDLSSESSLKGVNTAYVWNETDESGVAAASSLPDPDTTGASSFVFNNQAFGGKEIYCVMTNSLYPDLMLVTTNVKVGEAPFSTTITTTTTTTTESATTAVTTTTEKKTDSPNTGESKSSTMAALGLALISLSIVAATMGKNKFLQSVEK